jgi:hypothetical protein
MSILRARAKANLFMDLFTLYSSNVLYRYHGREHPKTTTMTIVVLSLLQFVEVSEQAD